MEARRISSVNMEIFGGLMMMIDDAFNYNYIQRYVSQNSYHQQFYNNKNKTSSHTKNKN